MIQQKTLPSKVENHNFKKNTLSLSSKDIEVNPSGILFNPERYLKPALTGEEIKDVKDVFDIFDTEGRGLVHAKGTFECEKQDLIDALRSINYSQKENTAYQQLMDLGADGEGDIKFEKFLTLLTTRVTENDSESDMKQLFSMFDDDKCGFVTVKNLRRSVREMGVDVGEEELQKMIEVADLDKDGRVSEEEFFTFMTGKAIEH